MSGYAEVGGGALRRRLRAHLDGLRGGGVVRHGRAKGREGSEEVRMSSVENHGVLVFWNGCSSEVLVFVC